jgi:hypothetical protein
MRFDLLDGQVVRDSIYVSCLDIALEDRISWHGVDPNVYLSAASFRA